MIILLIIILQSPAWTPLLAKILNCDVFVEEEIATILINSRNIPVSDSLQYDVHYNAL